MRIERRDQPSPAPSRAAEDPGLKPLIARYRDERRRHRAFVRQTDPYDIYVVAAELSSQRLEALRHEITRRLGRSTAR